MSGIRTKILLFLLLLLTGSASRTFADDAAMEGEGGAVRMMHGHPSIRMVSEVVKAKLPEGRVDATFVFHNDGPETTVTIGFPEEATYFVEDEANNMPLPFTSMKGFHSWVDSKAVTTHRIVSHYLSGDDYYIWWTKQVRFAAGQTRVVRDSYTGGAYIIDGEGTIGFEYVLTTGSSWHGPIGDATMICDLSSLHGKSPLYFQPTDGHRSGDEIVWHEHNIKPTRDIIVAWMNRFCAVHVNGKPVWSPTNAEDAKGNEYWNPKEDLDLYNFGWQSGDWGNVAAVRKGDDVWLSAKTACSWLRASDTLIKDGHGVIISYGDKSVQVVRGSAFLELDSSQAIRMPSVSGHQSTSYDMPTDTAPEKDGYTMLYLRPLVTALGGTSSWNATNDRLLINLPPVKQ